MPHTQKDTNTTKNQYLLLLKSTVDATNNLKRSIALINCFSNIIKKSSIYKKITTSEALTQTHTQAIIITSQLDIVMLNKEITAIQNQLNNEKTKETHQLISINIEIHLENNTWITNPISTLNDNETILPIQEIAPNKIQSHIQSLKKQSQINSPDTIKVKQKSKTALITGASKRVGRHLALTLAKNGFDIICHYHSSKKDASELAKTIKALGKKCTLWREDFTKKTIHTHVLQRHKIDLLVNCAATFFTDQEIKKDEKLKDDQWHVNFISPKKLISDYIKFQDKGHIINILDKEIIKNQYDNHNHYLSTKKLLHCFGLQMSANCRPLHRINSIAPGWILGPVNQKKTYWQAKDKIKERKLPRKGDLADLSQCVIFLEENDFINGQVIFVDGGDHLN